MKPSAQLNVSSGYKLTPPQSGPYQNGTVEATPVQANEYAQKYLNAYSYVAAEQITKDIISKNININSVILQADKSLWVKTVFHPVVGEHTFLNRYISLLFRQIKLNDKTLRYLMEHSEVEKNCSLALLLSTPLESRQTPILSANNMDYLLDNSNYSEETKYNLKATLFDEPDNPQNKGAVNFITTYFLSFGYLKANNSPNNILTPTQIDKLIDLSDVNTASNYDIDILKSMVDIFDYIELSDNNLNKIIKKLELKDKAVLKKFVSSTQSLLRSAHPKIIALLDKIDTHHQTDWVKLLLKEKRKMNSLARMFSYFALPQKNYLLFDKKIPLSPDLKAALCENAEDKALLEKRLLLDTIAPAIKPQAKLLAHKI